MILFVFVHGQMTEQLFPIAANCSNTCAVIGLRSLCFGTCGYISSTLHWCKVI